MASHSLRYYHARRASLRNKTIKTIIFRATIRQITVIFENEKGGVQPEREKKQFPEKIDEVNAVQDYRAVAHKRGKPYALRCKAQSGSRFDVRGASWRRCLDDSWRITNAEGDRNMTTSQNPDSCKAQSVENVAFPKEICCASN